MKTYIKLFILLCLYSCASSRSTESKDEQTNFSNYHETFRLDVGGAQMR